MSENNIVIESNLQKVLFERESKKKIFVDKYSKYEKSSKNFSWQSITELALLEKLNHLWQGFWGTSEVYKLFSEDEKLIHSLIIKKELT